MAGAGRFSPFRPFSVQIVFWPNVTYSIHCKWLGGIRKVLYRTAVNWDDGLPSYLLPPQINPSFANNQSVGYWQLHDAVRAPEDLNWTFNIQRQVTPNTIVQVGYNATVGTHLQTSVVNMNQTPTTI